MFLTLLNACVGGVWIAESDLVHRQETVGDPVVGAAAYTRYL